MPAGGMVSEARDGRDVCEAGFADECDRCAWRLRVGPPVPVNLRDLYVWSIVADEVSGVKGRLGNMPKRGVELSLWRLPEQVCGVVDKVGGGRQAVRPGRTFELIALELDAE